MTDWPTLYYVTTPEDADTILRCGFGGEGKVTLKDKTYEGDRSEDRAIIAVSFACDISQFVQPESAIGYRTWRIPATFINSHAKSRTIHGRLLVSPKFKHYVERVHPPPPDQIAKIVDSAIFERMIDCLQRMRPRHRPRSVSEKERLRSEPMDRGRARQIVEKSLAITWKWIAEDQYRDTSRFRYDDERKRARDASDLIFQLHEELDFAAPRNLALNDTLERLGPKLDFDREMLEEWLSDISALTGAKDGELPGGLTSREILHAWDTMHPIVRSEVERRLRSESAGSIRAALIRIPILINEALKALSATKLPHARVLQRRLDALLRQYGLGFGALASEHGRASVSQRFARLAQEAFGVKPVSVSRHHIQDEHRRERSRARRRLPKR